MKIDRDRFSRKKGQEWLDWLSDDHERAPEDIATADAQPEPVVHRKPSAATPKPTKQPVVQANARPAASSRPNTFAAGRAPIHGVYDPSQRVTTPMPDTKSQKTVSIHLHLPNIRTPKLPKVSRQQLRHGTALVVLTLGLGIGARAGLELLTDRSNDKPAVNGASTAAAKPSFSPLVTKDSADKVKAKSIYDPKRQLYTYEDTLLKSPITLSQQPVPANLKDNPAAVREIGRSIGADMTIKTAFGDAYVATSENKSSQRVVTVRGNVLMFIETVKTYDEETWKFYLESLK